MPPRFDPFELREPVPAREPFLDSSPPAPRPESRPSRPKEAFSTFSKADPGDSPQELTHSEGVLDLPGPSSSSDPGASDPASGVGGAGDGILLTVYCPKPPYPASARRRRIQGVTTLDCVIRIDGSISSATIAEGSGSDLLDQAALETVRQWRYEALGVGRLEIRRQRLRIIFKLED